MIIDIETLLKQNHIILPNKNLGNIIKWFYDIFGEEVNKEGWRITELGYNTWKGFDYSGMFKVRCIFPDDYDYTENTQTITKEKAFEYAEYYGWVIANNGLVYDYNIDKLTRNKHLIIGTELGLL